jgi:hypothetical protein
MIDESEHRNLSKAEKLWVSNVVLETEVCDDERINSIALEIKKKLTDHLLNNFHRLLEKARKKVAENFFGK